MSILKIMLLLSWSVFFSCSKKITPTKQYKSSSIQLNEIVFKDENFKKLLSESITKFRKNRKNSEHSVLVIEVYQNNSNTEVSLSNYFFLGTFIQAEMLLNYKYDAAIVYKEFLIISKHNDYSLPNDFYEVSDEMTKFNFLIGDNLDWCEENYKYENKKFHKVKNFCTDYLYTK